MKTLQVDKEELTCLTALLMKEEQALKTELKNLREKPDNAYANPARNEVTNRLYLVQGLLGQLRQR